MIRVDEKWVREIHRATSSSEDKYTFCGVLEDKYNHIAYYWDPGTRKKFESKYNNIILPALKNHNEKTIREYTREDYIEAIEYIKACGYKKKGIVHRYSNSSIKEFKKLIYYVVHFASSHGLCDNVLRDTSFFAAIPKEEQEIEARVRLKKSLTVMQEKELYKHVMMDIEEDGAIVALLLMWALGLRNAEACGLNYGDIKQLEGHPDCYAAWIYKSTKIKSNELQSGGKTYNTGRIIPIPERVFDFLLERKKLVEKVLSEQGKALNVDELPICCVGQVNEENNCLEMRCRADQVSDAAHGIFDVAGISSMQLRVLKDELEEGNTATLLKEKEPTAYLLRRNFATQMSILGLTNAEMQYLLGHDVEDAYESRNEFVDNDRIYAMHLKLKQRALLNNTCDFHNKVDLCINPQELVKIHIAAKEPTDSICISVSGDSDLQMKWFEESVSPKYDRTVNILESYHKKYQKK